MIIVLKYGSGEVEVKEVTDRLTEEGLIIEVHPQTVRAVSDGKQSHTPANFEAMTSNLAGLAELLGRPLKGVNQ
ncbi:MAG: hypothetical protein WA131_12125 [Desulfitobacteriaceae bacterium]